MHAEVGDTVEVDSTGLGTPSRRGTILEVRGELGHEYYRVRWQDEHESVFFPSTTTHVTRPDRRTARESR